MEPPSHRDPRKKINFELKIKIDGKKIVQFVKYLGIYIDNHLSWHQQERDLRSRLSRAAGMLCKIRHYVSSDTLRMVYYGIFSSILVYGSLIWGQHDRIVKGLQVIQNKAIRYMNFKTKRTTATPLFKKSGILKLTDYITVQNCLFAYESINKTLPTPLLDDNITLSTEGNNTRRDQRNQLEIMRTRTILYGTKSIKSKAIEAWNKVNIQIHHLKLQDKNKSTCKESISKLLLDRY